MSAKHNRQQTRLDTEALVIGYAMSRWNQEYFMRLGVSNWKAAYAQASLALEVPTESFKNLRDEFDPLFPNGRQGWKREMRADRQRVALDLSEVSDDALLELVNKILQRDAEATNEAIDALIPDRNVAAAVAERLLTGRRAEEFFLEHSRMIVGIDSRDLLDCRLNAGGFDFAISTADKRVFEIKGMKSERGDILFTDREWNEAERRGENYGLVVIGRLTKTPAAKVIYNPRKYLSATCQWRKSITASWRSSVSVTST